MFMWIKNAVKKAAKVVKKAANKVITFVKEHKVDIIVEVFAFVFPHIGGDIKDHRQRKEEERIWEEKRKTATIIK